MSGTTSTGSLAATGAFHVTNGQIIGPDGTPFVARGVAVLDGNLPSPGTLLSDFPGLNFVRLAVFNYTSPDALASYVNSLTSQGIVVELEDHSNNAGNSGGSAGTIFTGSALNTELNWYSSIATAFKANPYVWFGTDNEPSQIDAAGNNDPAALSAWQEQTVQAITNTGNNNPVMVEMNSWGPGQTGIGYSQAAYSGLHNIIWDVHYYGWESGYSTDQTTVSTTLSSIVSEAQQLTSGDGTVPVIIGEYGNSTTGGSLDANGTQAVKAVLQSGLGNVAWAWGVGPGDALTDDGSGLSAYGQQVAAGIASAAAAAPTPALIVTPLPAPAAALAPAPAAATASPDQTVVTGTAAAITDASGNAWTITAGGQVAANGTADPSTNNVIQLDYVNGEIWQENTSSLWWSKTTPAGTWAAGPGTGPLPASGTTSSAMVSASQVSVTSTAGDRMVFISGSADVVNLTGGANTITDTGNGNTYVIPVAGKGYDTFTSNIFNNGGALDLGRTLAATKWNGTTSDLTQYIKCADYSQGAVLSVVSSPGGAATAIATINGISSASLMTLLSAGTHSS
jgi:hypothetical protein